MALCLLVVRLYVRACVRAYERARVEAFSSRLGADFQLLQ